MPPAARMLDPTSHPGLIVQGLPTVLINGLPAARQGDVHACMLPPVAGPHPPSPIARGSKSVRIGNQGAARQFDSAGCGAQILAGSPNVIIGD